MNDKERILLLSLVNVLFANHESHRPQRRFNCPTFRDNARKLIEETNLPARRPLSVSSLYQTFEAGDYDPIDQNDVSSLSIPLNQIIALCPESREISVATEFFNLPDGHPDQAPLVIALEQAAGCLIEMRAFKKTHQPEDSFRMLATAFETLTLSGEYLGGIVHYPDDLVYQAIMYVAEEHRDVEVSGYLDALIVQDLSLLFAAPLRWTNRRLISLGYIPGFNPRLIDDRDFPQR